MAYHALLSPSSASRWTSCTASVGAQAGVPNEGNEAARRGTACHLMLEEMLLDPSIDPQGYLGRKLYFWVHAESESSGENWWHQMVGDDGEITHHWTQVDIPHDVEVDQEMVDISVTAVNYVRERAALTGAEMYVEQAVPIGQFTGEEGATGRTDVVLIYGDTVEVIDLKGGRMRVDAYEVLKPATSDIITGKPVPEVVRANLQMACYALGTVEKLGLLYDFRNVVMTIVQPAISHLSTYSCSIDELREVEAFLRQKAKETRTSPQYVPSAESCHFCRASGNCAAQNEMVLTAALEGFEDDSKPLVPRQVSSMRIGETYELVPLVRTWMKAVEAQMTSALQAGLDVRNADGLAYKLVVGREGDREWTSEKEAVEALKAMRLKADQMFTKKVISPAGAEKLAKAKKAKKGETPVPPVIGPTQWNRLQALITRSDGKPTIALETDPRPAVASATDGFDDVPPADLSDLF